MTDEQLPVIEKVDGLWWPVDNARARGIITGDCDTDVSVLLEHTEGRGLIIQAGGNVGVYAMALSSHFEHVITYEPDRANFNCLERNLGAHDNLCRVTAYRAALGEHRGVCTPTVVEHGNCGAHRVAFDTGVVPVVTIDDGARLDGKVAAIWLDVEGSELFALMGAVKTITAHRPTIVIEDKGLDALFFNVPPGSVQAFLASLGYTQVARNGRDKIFKDLSNG